MSERTPWWKSFLGIGKTNGLKDVSPTLAPDFNPFSSKDPVVGPGSKASSQPGKKEDTSPLSDDTYDDSHLESVFNEQTCRRNMRVSRSGRFKEKRKVRTTLPIEEQEQDKNGPRKEDQR